MAVQSIGRLPNAAAMAAGVLLIVAAAAVPRTARALPGLDNAVAAACQSYAGAHLVAYELAALVVPPPFDLVPTVGAYSTNLALRLCPPQLVAPPDKVGPDGFDVVATGNTATGAEVTAAQDDDPACYADVRQTLTSEHYENVYGAEVFGGFSGEWGELGAVQTYHFNTPVEVRLLDPDLPRQAINPLQDAWALTDTAGGHVIRLPVGKHQLVYRADTHVSLMDFAFVYIPKLPTTTKAFRDLAKKSKGLGRAVLNAAAGTLELAAILDTGSILTTAGPVALDQALGISFRHGQLLVRDDVYLEDSQSVWVYDRIPPELSSSTDLTVLSPRDRSLVSYDADRDVFYLEAIEPGGIRAGDGVRLLRQLLTYSDRCDRPVTVTHDGGGALFWPTNSTVQLTWTATDPGPADASGRGNSVSLTHRIEVRDSFPPILLAPPSQVHEIEAGSTGSTIDIELGSPRVFDLADLSPTVESDAAGGDFGLGLSEITWSATDDGDNTSSAVQLINIKEAGTNTPPIALPATVTARSFEPTEIVLTGTDADYHPSVDRHDPLTFRITRPPENGELIAPLLPYFIDDFRLEAGLERFADDPQQNDPQGYCNAGGPGPDTYHLAYPFLAKWVAVNDDGQQIVHDLGFVQCSNMRAIFSERLVMFNADHTIAYARDLAEGTTVRDIFWDFRTGQIYVLRTQADLPNRIDTYANDLTPLLRYDLESRSREDRDRGAPTLSSPNALSVGSNGHLYVATDREVHVYQRAGLVSADPNIIATVSAASYWLGRAWEKPDSYLEEIESIAVDSSRHLYVALRSRLVKIAPASITLQDSIVGNPIRPSRFEAGRLVGWMGRCSGNLSAEYLCDTRAQRSLGYVCTDAKCDRTVAAGGAPGQFNAARKLAIDPKDVLYVTDAASTDDLTDYRVQRFTADGSFGGQTVSTGVGYGFLLGDFGFPTDIEVNSSHFYLLDGDANLLHSFAVTPITPIDDGSASVLYRADNNFIGTDSFDFSASDGFDTDAATIEIDVQRNFRAPEILSDSLAIAAPQLGEDTSTTLVIDALDPDGALDTLTVVVVDPPANGSLTIEGLTVTYVPDADFFGTDQFTYRVSDGSDESAELGTVFLQVDAAADPPRLGVDQQLEAKLGFPVELTIHVEDPDPDETLLLAVMWGDGSESADGRLELDGAPIDPVHAFNEDGTPREGLGVTGPILAVGPTGRATLSLPHTFVAAGTYQVETCIFDQGVVDPVTQIKSLTSASQSDCGTTVIHVVNEPELSGDILQIEPVAAGPIAAGSSVVLQLRLHNLEFAIGADDPRAGQLPVTGTDAYNLVIRSGVTAGLEISRVTSGAASCPVLAGSVGDGQDVSCELPQLDYGTSIEIDFETRVAEDAPGGAALGVEVEVVRTGADPEVIAIGSLTVAASSDAPNLIDISPSSARPSDYALVTIRGENFQAGAAVYIGEQRSTEVSVLSATELTAQVPFAPLGSADVRVVNPDGQGDLLADAWTYVSEPPETPPVTPPSAPAARRGGGAIDILTIWLLSWLLICNLRGHRARSPARQASA